MEGCCWELGRFWGCLIGFGFGFQLSMGLGLGWLGFCFVWVGLVVVSDCFWFGVSRFEILWDKRGGWLGVLLVFDKLFINEYLKFDF